MGQENISVLIQTKISAGPKCEQRSNYGSLSPFLVYRKSGDVFVTKLAAGIPCSAAPHLEAAMLL